MTTIPSNQLETVTGGLLNVREPQTDAKGAIVGGKVVGKRENNFACDGAICGGERIRLMLF
jgi:hypothetical protein